MAAAARIATFAVFYVFRRVTQSEFPVSEAAFANWLPWALGALSVECALGITQLPAWTRSAPIACGAVAITFALGYLPGLPARILWFGLSYCYALAFFLLTNACIAREGRLKSSLLWQGLAGLGVFSYSLYLTHELPLHYGLAPIAAFLPGLQLSGQMLVLTPLSLGLAWLFHLAFEKPFMSASRPRNLPS
jgi:peptidoglycan/LPS O-acetylase OafA/YrhL